jgi:RIO kinase 2
MPKCKPLHFQTYTFRYFNRDVQCIRTFFLKKFNYETDTYPLFTVDAAEKKYNLDIAVAASGFTNQDQIEFEEVRIQRVFS